MSNEQFDAPSDADDHDGPTIEITSDLLLAEVERLRSVVNATRATLLDAATNDATSEEWERQARAALHVLTLPNAWPAPESQSETDRAAWERLRVPVVITFARALREGAQETIEVADDELTVAYAEGQIQVCEKITQMLVDEPDEAAGELARMRADIDAADEDD